MDSIVYKTQRNTDKYYMKSQSNNNDQIIDSLDLKELIKYRNELNKSRNAQQMSIHNGTGYVSQSTRQQINISVLKCNVRINKLKKNK